MLDDDKGARQDAASTHGQELLVSMRTHRPAVPVLVKKRRVLLPATNPSDPAAPQDATPGGDRAPRVFRVAGAGGPEAAAVEAAPAGEALPAPRRRPADPLRRPGEVTRIVFDVPEPEPEPAPPPSFVPAGYADVQASLERVRAELDRAKLARRFRL